MCNGVPCSKDARVPAFAAVQIATRADACAYLGRYLRSATLSAIRRIRHGESSCCMFETTCTCWFQNLAVVSSVNTSVCGNFLRQSLISSKVHGIRNSIVNGSVLSGDPEKKTKISGV